MRDHAGQRVAHVGILYEITGSGSLARGLPWFHAANVKTAHAGDIMNLRSLRPPRNVSNWIALLSTLALTLLVLGV